MPVRGGAERISTRRENAFADWQSKGEVYRIPKLLLFRNEFRSGMKFELYSRDKIDLLRLRRSPSRSFRARSGMVYIRYSPQTTRCLIFNPEQSLFSVYMIPE